MLRLGALVRDLGDLATVRRLRDAGLTIIELDCDDVDLLVCELAPALRHHVPTIVRTHLTRATVPTIIALAATTGVSRLSFRGASDLTVDLRQTLDGQPTWPELPIIHTLCTSRGNPILIAAASISSRRTGIQQLARLLEMAPRTLQLHCAQSRLPEPRALLGAMLALHTLWRLDILNWPLKKAAAAAGFRSTEALTNYIHRHTHARPTVLLRSGGFTYLLDKLVADLRIP
jgi:hypothetical protein